MTVSSSNGPTLATGNGSTTVFPFTFLAMSDAEVGVTVDGFAGSGYTVSLSDNAPATGSVTFAVAPANGAEIVLYSDPSPLQEIDIVNGGPFSSEVVERGFDRAAVRHMALEHKFDRSIAAPVGESLGELPAAAARAGYFLAFDGAGDPVPASGTGSDAAMRSDLAAPTGGSLVAYQAARTGAVARTMRARLDDTISLKDFAVGDDSDETTKIQQAINAAIAEGKALHVPTPPVAYKTTAPLTITGSLRIIGEGVSPYVSDVGTRGKGSWFHLAHLGKGFAINNSTGLMGGIHLKGIGTYRDQPTPGPGFTPIAADYDIDIVNSDVLLEDLMMLNPTKAVRLTNGNAGRLTMRHVRGQPLSIGLNIDDSYDSSVVNDLRWWPFWSADTNVTTYTLANRKGIILAHADNPNIADFFDIFSRFPVFFTASTNGVTSRAQIVGAGFDLFGEAAIYVEAGATETSFQFQGGYAVGHNSGATGQLALYCGANSCEMSLTGFRVSNVKTRAGTLAGTGNTLIVNGPHVNDWNTANAGNEAWGAAVSNKILLNGKGHYSGGNGAAKINDASLISSDQWLTSTPVPAAASGTLTSASSSIKYNRINDVVNFTATVSITTNGTGAGGVTLSLPLAASDLTTVIGREGSVSGKTLAGAINGSTMTIRNYDNTHPGTDGAMFVISGQYKVAAL